jgi:glycine hydroxymethyltransferase
MRRSSTTQTETSTAVRPWLPTTVARRVSEISSASSDLQGRALQLEIERLAEENHQIHDVTCLNLNPATNIMNPRAEALMAARLGSRASLGYPGEKYETGLEAIEQIEVLAADAAARVFGARYAEVRVGSGALSNLYAFMATCSPGDTVIAPPAAIGGHVTHHQPGAAGLYGLETLSAPVDADGYTVDVESLRTLAHQVRPKLITIGGSLNLFPHPVGEIRGVADEVGALVLFDAAHQCGMFAGKAWPNPLAEGAHLMTMSTYKSLGGPPGGLIVTNEADLAERLEAIAYPGLTANFDAGKTAALALTLADWEVAGPAYARAMIETAQALAAALTSLGVPVFAAERGATASHQFAILAHVYGGGQQAARTLRLSNLLASGIGLPGPPVDGDLNGLRIGTPEIVRLGMTEDDMPQLALFIARGLADDTGSSGIGDQVTQWRAQFRGCHFTADTPS